MSQPSRLCAKASNYNKETLTPEDFGKVMELLKLRPLQFCIFLKMLVGVDEMQRMMVHAIAVAKQN